MIKITYKPFLGFTNFLVYVVGLCNTWLGFCVIGLSDSIKTHSLVLPCVPEWLIKLAPKFYSKSKYVIAIVS